MKDEQYVKQLEDEIERLRSWAAHLEARMEMQERDGPYHQLHQLAMEEGKADEVFERCVHQFHYQVTHKNRRIQNDMVAIEEVTLQRCIPLAPVFPWKNFPLTFPGDRIESSS